MEPSQSLYRDFVLISEFSELEGPLPLAVVADTNYIDLKATTAQSELKILDLDHFDFNAFVLRVVSTDRSEDNDQHDATQAEPTPQEQEKGDPYLSTSPPRAARMFSIPNDTQVYFSDSEYNFYAFTHHLTLFDINARGYVHPVALSFVTRDPDKIVWHFEAFMEKFNEVSRLMKKGNFSNFTLDLKCRLLDLEHTRTELCSTKKQPSTSSTCMPDEALQQAITVTKLIVETIEPYAVQPNKDGTSPPEQAGMIEPPKNYKPSYIDTLYPVAHFERKLRTLAQLCQEPDPEEVTSRCERANLLRTTMIPLASSIEPLRKTPSLRRRRSFATAIAHDMYAEATKCLSDVIRDLGRSSVALDMDEEEAPILEPLSDAITIGRTFVLNMDNPHPRTDSHASRADEKPIPKENSVEKRAPLQPDSKESTATDMHAEAAGQPAVEAYFPVALASYQLRDAGQGNTLLRTLQQYHGCIHHVIFSLLTGRHVVVVGSLKTKRHVEATVHALSSFLPGHTKEHHCFLPWMSHSKLTDVSLSSYKLVGTDKENIDPSVHKLEISYFEIEPPEGNLVTSPLYLDGEWIHHLLDRVKLFTTDMAFLAYVHTVFMTIALKAYVYRHMCLVEFQDTTARPTSSSTVSKRSSQQDFSESSSEGGGSEVNKKWNVRRIMSYLRRIEEREHARGRNEAPQSEKPAKAQATTAHEREESKESEETFLDENEATVTPQSVRKHASLVSLDWGTPAPSTPDDERQHLTERKHRRRRRTSMHSDSTSSIGSFGWPLYLEEEFVSEDELESSSDESASRLSEHHAPRTDAPLSDEIPPIEYQGRLFLQDKLKIYGDDQTIVVYLAKLGGIE